MSLSGRWWYTVMCLSSRGLEVSSYVPFWKGFGGRKLCAFQVGVGGRQLLAFQVGCCW
jgi:hypothetical protein